MPSRKTRILILLFAMFLVLCICSLTLIFAEKNQASSNPTPFPTPIPSTTTPTRSPDQQFEEEVSLICESAYTNELERYLTFIMPAPTVIVKDSELFAGRLSLSGVQKAESMDELRTVVCIKEEREEVFEYEDGTPGYRIVWRVRLIAWPNGQIINSARFNGPHPHSFARNASETIGKPPVNALSTWLQAGFDENAHALGCIYEISVLSSDGTYLASNCGGNSVILSNFETGERIWSYKGEAHLRSVNDIVFSPDGKHLVIANGDNIVFLSAATGERLLILEGHDRPVTNLSFSPDGGLLASANRDNAIKLWNPVNGDELHTLVGHKVSFSHNGSILASASGNNSIKLWDPVTGTELNTFIGHSGSVTNIVFSPDDKVLASTSSDQTIKFWDVALGDEKFTLDSKVGSNSIAFSPDGIFFVSTTENLIKLWETKSGNHLLSIDHHQAKVTSVTFLPDRTIVSISEDKTMRFWTDVKE